MGITSPVADFAASSMELIDRGDDVVVIIHERARLRDSDTMLDSDQPTS